MTAEITFPALRPLSVQRPAVEALMELTDMFGHLPGAYITIHSPALPTAPAKLSLQCDSPRDFEQWRSALGVTPADVEVHERNGSGWLAVEGWFRGVRVHLTGFGVELPASVDAVSSGVAA